MPESVIIVPDDVLVIVPELLPPGSPLVVPELVVLPAVPDVLPAEPDEPPAAPELVVPVPELPDAVVPPSAPALLSSSSGHPELAAAAITEAGRMASINAFQLFFERIATKDRRWISRATGALCRTLRTRHCDTWRL